MTIRRTLIIAFFTQSDSVISWSLDTLCRITCIIKVWLHLSVGDTLLSVICWGTVYWCLKAFHCISMPSWYVGCYFTVQNYLCIHKVCQSSHTNTHMGNVHLCLYCSYKNLVGIVLADKHKNSGKPKKLHRTSQRSLARLCEKLIGRKNWKTQSCAVCATKTCRHSRGTFPLVRKLGTKWRWSMSCSGHFIREKLKGKCVLTTP